MAGPDYSKHVSKTDDLFTKAPFNAEKGREKLLARIKRTSEQLTGQATTKGGKDYELGHNNQVRYRPTLNGKPITLPNMTGDYFAATTSGLGALLTDFGKDVEAGHFDKQIEDALSFSSSSGRGTSSVGGGRKSPEEKHWTKRKDWDSLSASDKKSISARYRRGKNPDNSLIAEGGHKPDAKFARD